MLDVRNEYLVSRIEVKLCASQKEVNYETNSNELFLYGIFNGADYP